MICPQCDAIGTGRGTLESLPDGRLSCSECNWQGSEGDAAWAAIEGAHDMSVESAPKRKLCHDIYLGVAIRMLPPPKGYPDPVHEALIYGILAAFTVGETWAQGRLARVQAGLAELTKDELASLAVLARLYPQDNPDKPPT